MATKKKAIDKSQKYSAPALEKGLDILEILSDEPEGLSTRELSERLQRSVGELFRMIVVLEQRGYIDSRADSDRYSLSLKVFELAHRFPPVRRLTTVAGPLLKELSFAIGQSCHITIYYEGKGHVVVQQDSPAERTFTVKLGAEAPLINSCSGHLLLAYASAVEQAGMLAKIPPHHTKPKRGEVEAMVKRIKAKGFERIKSGQISGVEDIGYPIFDHKSELVGALIVPYVAFLDSTEQLAADAVQEQVVLAAQKLSNLLGFEGS